MQSSHNWKRTLSFNYEQIHHNNLYHWAKSITSQPDVWFWLLIVPIVIVIPSPKVHTHGVCEVHRGSGAVFWIEIEWLLNKTIYDYTPVKILFKRCLGANSIPEGVEWRPRMYRSTKINKKTVMFCYIEENMFESFLQVRKCVLPPEWDS